MGTKKYISLQVILCLIFLTGGQCDIETSRTKKDVEDIIVRSYISYLGGREYLPPHLPGLHRLARSFIPESYKVVSIIEAFREINNAIHYDLLVNTIDENDTAIVCHIIITEKPWLRSQIGEKLRFLEYSNCSSYNGLDFSPNIESEYTPKTPTDRELNYNNVIDVESQIVPKNEQRDNDAGGSDTSYNSSPYYTGGNNNEETSEPKQPGTSEVPTDRLSTDVEGFLDAFFSVDKTRESEPRNKGASSHSYSEDNERDIRSKRSVSDRDCSNEGSCAEYNTFKNCAFNVDGITPATGIDCQIHEKEHVRRDQHKVQYLFQKFQRKFKRSYETTMEKAMRYRIFKKNLAKIQKLNKMEQGTAVYGITEFADMTEAEYRQRTGLIVKSKRNNNSIKNTIAPIPNWKLPREFDWRQKGVITRVKDQGQCGSCWAFSVIGNIEGLHAIKSGKLEEYSEQELLDCDIVDGACGGGEMDDAYKAIEKLGGLESESDYPYKARQGQCHFNRTKVHVEVKDAIDLPKNETAIALWLIENGPISIGLNANAMQFYRGGISHPWKVLCRPGGVDHAVLLVGFGIAEYPLFNKTLPYWIIKNSWGPKWGESGYYRLYRGSNACGINTMASSAVLA